MGTILSTGYLQWILGSVLQSPGLTRTAGVTASGGTGAQGPYKSQISPFGQVVSTLQQLQQSNPTQYRQIAQQSATNLQKAAQTAQAGGNSTAANELNQLATDFSNGSQSGQLPS